MSMRMHILFTVVLSLLGGWAAPGPASAREPVEREGFVLGAWAGYGRIDVDADNVSKSGYGSFAFGLRGGYAVTPGLVAALEVNGWTLKAYDNEDPSKGESVSTVSLSVDWFPSVRYPVFIEGGGGYLSYSNNSPGVGGRDHGATWFVGTGYEYPLSKSAAVVPRFRYARGNFTGGSFGVYELSLGLDWYSGK